jgi:hypothetical protein
MRNSAALTFYDSFAFIDAMRVVFIVVCALLLSGCAHSSNGNDGAKGQKRVNSMQPSVARAVVQRGGSVISVNDSLLFVVIDFSSGEVPPLNSHLNVYRSGQKVAELNLSGPVRNGNAVADIRAGRVKVGDEVRVD